MLKIYNTLTKKIQDFKPIKEDKVGIYVCGPTVYGPVHLGHARTWIFFDWLKRYLIAQEYKVKFVQNITDVGHLVADAEIGEDKVEKEAKEQGKTPKEIALFWENEYFKDLELLNILKPDISPRATEHIDDMIDFIKVLLEKGFAYEVSGNVYFEVRKLKDYGKLSGRNIAEEESNKRIAIDKKKKSPVDFALWLKADKSHIQKWPSPWSEGYPGWHLECSVMSKKYLGQPFDIHGGGIDNIFPHHENELAQSKAYLKTNLANFWLHAGTLLVDGKKMAKSLNNYITLKGALKGNDQDTIKLAMMNNHWRSPFNWEEGALKEARILRDRLVRAKSEAQPIKTGIPTEIQKELENDFNVPKVLAVILRDPSKLSRDDFKYIENIFGLNLESEIKLTVKQKKLISNREKARGKGDYKEADKLRGELAKEGLIIEDTTSGTRVISKN